MISVTEGRTSRSSTRTCSRPRVSSSSIKPTCCPMSNLILMSCGSYARSVNPDVDIIADVRDNR